MKKIRLWLLKLILNHQRSQLTTKRRKKTNIVMPISPANQLTLDIFFPYSSRTSFDIYEWHFDKAKSMNENFFLNSIAVNPTKNTWPKDIKTTGKSKKLYYGANGTCSN